MEANALGVILVMTAVTFGLRALPFFAPLPQNLVTALRRAEAKLPTLFLALLVVYCLEKALNLNVPALKVYEPENIYLLAASLSVAVVHWLWGRLLLSLFLGTGVYLSLMNLI